MGASKWCLALVAGVPVAVAVMTAGEARADRDTEQLVLIVGVGDHLRDPGHRLHYSDDSALVALHAARLAIPSARVQVLAVPEDPDTAGGFEAAGVEPLPPTRADLELVMQDFSRAAHEARSRGRSVRLLFYFTGFADPGGVFHLADEPVDLEAVVSLMEQVGPDRAFALIDVASPARIAADTRAPIAPQALLPSASELASRPGWFGYLGATSTDTQMNNTQGGLLTAVAFTGLLGAADLDEDRKVTFFEWRQFIRMQIDLKKPFAPLLHTMAPRRDPLATVVDLSRSIASRMVVDAAIPNGIMEVRDPSEGRLLAQWYHYQGFQDRICVPSGRLGVHRYSDRTPRRVQGADGQVLYVPNRIYPVERVTFTIGPGEVVGYDKETDTAQVYLVPADRGTGGSFPEGSQVVPLSPEEEVRLIGLLFRTTRDDALALPPPGWYLNARVAVPAPLDVDFSSGVSTSGGSPAPALNGVAVRMARTVPRALRNRWVMARMFFFEYGQYEVRDVTARDLDGNRHALTAARAHQFRLGPGLRQTHLGPAVRWDFEESLSYGPRWVVGGGTDAEALSGLGFLSLTEIVLEGSAAVMFRVGNTLEWGPLASLQVGLFHDNLPGRLQVQPMVGVVVRPQVVRE